MVLKNINNGKYVYFIVFYKLITTISIKPNIVIVPNKLFWNNNYFILQ